MKIRDRILEHRITKATDIRDDLRHYIDTWGFARTPSQMRKLTARLDAAEIKVVRLRAQRKTFEAGDR